MAPPPRNIHLRHDIDNDLDKALKLAKLEKQLGVKSTYFVLLSTQFYNIAAKECRNKVLKIKSLGHDIGLHFDEMNYDDCNIEDNIILESKIMSSILGLQIGCVSMHRPSKETLDADYHLRGMLINSYGSKFFNDYKYVSDSRRRWREDVKTIIEANRFNKLHILTHAFWYNDNEKTIRQELEEYINIGNIHRYNIMKDNITDLESILPKAEIM